MRVYVLLVASTITATLTPPATAELGADWVRATGAAPWHARSGHEIIAFDDRLWLLGGSRYDDIWHTTDGYTWTRVQENTAWEGRRQHATEVFQGKLWLMGGKNADGVRISDVWNTSDGKQWTKIADAPWPTRTQFDSVVHENKLWVIGGAGDGHLNDVWNSEDGITWTQVAETSPWISRWGHSLLSFDGKIWLLGGGKGTGPKLDDIWHTTDGVNWTEVETTSQWSGRAGHSAVVFDNRMWVIGAREISTVSRNDVWSSPDGIAWTEHTSNAAWLPRGYHDCTVYDEKIWLTGGGEVLAGNLLNDVWYTDASIVGEGEGETEGQQEGEPQSGDDIEVEMFAEGNRYTPGTSVTIDVEIRSGQQFAQIALGLIQSLPPGWTFEGVVSGNTAPIVPEPGTQNRLEFAWIDSPVFPIGFSYDLAVPETTTGPKIIGGVAIYRITGPELQSDFAALQLTDSDFSFHSADQDHDWQISLSELLRIIQFYNLNEYHCEAATEDGFAPGNGDGCSAPHTSDFVVQDWQIDLSELLRSIQFFNSQRYYPCLGGEDGHCAGMPNPNL